MNIWNELVRRGFPEVLVSNLRQKCLLNSDLAFDLNALARESGVGIEIVRSLLHELNCAGVVGSVITFRCKTCHTALSKSESASKRCPSCGCDLVNEDDVEGPFEDYILGGATSRDVDWVVTIHGMNTLGQWQEEYCWRLALLNKYSIPVTTFKYGLFRFGIMSSTRRKHIIRELANRILAHSVHAKEAGLSERPDIIAHSFGTWLIGYALQQTDIKIGRLILTGCILPRDFNWKSIIDADKVEAVLNHYGTKDFWARMSFLIPGAGQSGRYGFTSEGVINKEATNYKHSDFFTEDKLKQQFDGLWTQFLTVPIGNLKPLIQDEQY